MVLDFSLYVFGLIGKRITEVGVKSRGAWYLISNLETNVDK